jgi:branched-chain amino acid transport system permease protein
LTNDNSAITNSARVNRLEHRTIIILMICGFFFVFAIPYVLPTFIVSMIVKIFIFGIFAMSLNVLWGNAGLSSMGHAAYFGIGAYTQAILLIRFKMENFWIVSSCSIIVTLIAAAFIAIPTLRTRGTYFLLVTMAMGELFRHVAIKWKNVTGSSYGLFGINYPDLKIPGFGLKSTSFYYLILIIFIICMFLFYRLRKSPFGYVINGIRENEGRMKFLGYNTWLYKYLAFIIGSGFAGLSGALFIHFNGAVSPAQLSILLSFLAILMVILGGCSVIFGPILGTLIVVSLDQISSIYFPERWPLILGGVFVVTVMILPGGFSVYLMKLWRRIFREST